MLRMKTSCEGCGASLGLTDQAFICSFECTYCPKCAKQLQLCCPNCQGQLTLRPIRNHSPTEVPPRRFKAKLEKLFS